MLCFLTEDYIKELLYKWITIYKNNFNVNDLASQLYYATWAVANIRSENLRHERDSNIKIVSIRSSNEIVVKKWIEEMILALAGQFKQLSHMGSWKNMVFPLVAIPALTRNYLHFLSGISQSLQVSDKVQLYVSAFP